MAMNLESVMIADEQAGSTAKILVGFGFNCYSFQVPRRDGELEVLWAAADFESGRERPSGSGIPILFPFPGRIRGGVYTYRGKRYELDANDGLGNAIHGFVLDRPWRLIERSTNRAVGQIRLAEAVPSLGDRWPADAELTATYELSGTTLTLQVRIENCDSSPLPLGFGTHPYFRLPLGPAGRLETCHIMVPAKSYWELDGLVPTGRKLPAAGAKRLVERRALADDEFDDVLGDLKFDDGFCTTRLEDPTSGRRVAMTFDDGFGTCVVYTPPHRGAICIEPYTCVPDAVNASGADVETGLRVLEPGESVSLRIEIRVE
jgi:aldose 1-epimerase